MDTEVVVEVRKVALEEMESAEKKMQGVQGIFNFFTYIVEGVEEELETV